MVVQIIIVASPLVWLGYSLHTQQGDLARLRKATLIGMALYLSSLLVLGLEMGLLVPQLDYPRNVSMFLGLAIPGALLNAAFFGWAVSPGGSSAMRLPMGMLLKGIAWFQVSPESIGNASAWSRRSSFFAALMAGVRLFGIFYAWNLLRVLL